MRESVKKSPSCRKGLNEKKRRVPYDCAQDLPGLERKLKADITGDVMFDRFSRGRYATDASHYQMMPLGVVAPRTVEEAERRAGARPRGGRDRAAARRRNLAVRSDR